MINKKQKIKCIEIINYFNNSKINKDITKKQPFKVAFSGSFLLLSELNSPLLVAFMQLVEHQMFHHLRLYLI
tara:strand:+ start:16537 stop:16752 length:216 start_codon:yes stop_codon:yes gene_type:complete